MSSYDHIFEAVINKYDYGKYYYTVVYIPDTVANKLGMPQRMRLRVEVEIDDAFAKGTLMPDRVGSNQTKHLLTAGYKKDQRIWYYQVPRRILNQINKTYNDTVTIKLRVGNQDEVEMHPAQEDFLAENPNLSRVWQSLTPGKRRSLSYPILKAKTDKTLHKRLDELESILMDLQDN